MNGNEEAPLAFAAGRLQWALAQPLRWGETEWLARTQRAVAGLRHALRWHVAATESAAGVVTRGRNRTLFPLTPAAERSAELRREHRRLQDRAAALQTQLALAAASPADRAFRSSFGIACRAEKLAGDVADHIAREKESELSV